VNVVSQSRGGGWGWVGGGGGGGGEGAPIWKGQECSSKKKFCRGHGLKSPSSLDFVNQFVSTDTTVSVFHNLS